MNLFNWLFGKKKPHKNAPSDIEQDKDADKIKVFDNYGREFYITKEQWKENVLIGNLEKAKNNPDELYNILVVVLQDGYFEEALKYAEILVSIDSQKSRSVTILGITYMKCNRLDDAERVLTNFIKSYGDNGVVLTNLAKVYMEQGDRQKAESVLWHALEVDPNQENGLEWYAAIQNERDGELAYSTTFTRVALIPTSWRAQLWLARFALQKNDLDSAIKLYLESIEKAGNPVPYDLLMQMSGDLGNNGYLKEIIELAQPHFQAPLHGIQVGNNLIKAYVDLDQFQDASEILNQLYDQNRSDWREFLSHWDTEIAKRGILVESKNNPLAESVTMFAIEGPLWCRRNSPISQLLPSKDIESVKISIFGNTTILTSTPERIGIQLTEAPGRTSRSIPLFLSEQINLTTNAETSVLIPWMQSKGFTVFGKPYSEKDICEMVENNDVIPDFVICVVVDVSNDHWGITVNVISRSDCLSLKKITVNCKPEDLGTTALELSKSVINSLIRYCGVNAIAHPGWYVIPPGVSSSDYLLRLEQLLAVTSMNQDFLEGGRLHGEHEIMEGIIFLNLSHPTNKTVRMLLAQTLIQMKLYKPSVVILYKEKIELLQKDHPLDGREGELISKMIADVF